MVLHTGIEPVTSPFLPIFLSKLKGSGLSLNLSKPSEGCDLNLVPLVAQDKTIKSVLSNSFGFGGTNASLILSKLN